MIYRKLHTIWFQKRKREQKRETINDVFDAIPFISLIKYRDKNLCFVSFKNQFRIFLFGFQNKLCSLFVSEKIRAQFSE